ncbi:hypothetical protein BDN72DRAFT_901140 [Pluteus cervinus]|uniref:Uncharacterized protein n=1 Tax=Pluteus cervinus TaxID=181527 RepID=A0ACD3AGA7_9AGAR|nr:hypothetical protein BDN72DRAFT_901140 [Pluteus cervinus]
MSKEFRLQLTGIPIAFVVSATPTSTTAIVHIIISIPTPTGFVLNINNTNIGFILIVNTNTNFALDLNFNTNITHITIASPCGSSDSVSFDRPDGVGRLRASVSHNPYAIFGIDSNDT